MFCFHPFLRWSMFYFVAALTSDNPKERVTTVAGQTPDVVIVNFIVRSFPIVIATNLALRLEVDKIT